MQTRKDKYLDKRTFCHTSSIANNEALTNHQPSPLHDTINTTQGQFGREYSWKDDTDNLALVETKLSLRMWITWAIDLHFCPHWQLKSASHTGLCPLLSKDHLNLHPFGKKLVIGQIHILNHHSTSVRVSLLDVQFDSVLTSSQYFESRVRLGERQIFVLLESWVSQSVQIYPLFDQ